MPFPNTETQFKPGVSANPGGRPKGRSITARLRDLLEKGEINGKPVRNGEHLADLVAEVIVTKALKGDHRFMQMLIDRVDGKLTQKIELGTDNATDAIRQFLRGDDEPTGTSDEAG
jgi:Family of unknown function (DUF5681)